MTCKRSSILKFSTIAFSFMTILIFALGILFYCNERVLLLSFIPLLCFSISAIAYINPHKWYKPRDGYVICMNCGKCMILSDYGVMGPKWNSVSFNKWKSSLNESIDWEFKRKSDEVKSNIEALEHLRKWGVI